MKKTKIIKTRLIVLGFLAAMISFLVLVGIKMATMETKLSLFTTFTMPEGVSLEKLGISVENRWAIAIDGKVVASNRGDEQQATASTTKMILALAVLDKKPFSIGEEGETFEITDEMYQKYVWYANNNGSNTRVYTHEEISEYDALVSALLASSNNMADSLAIWAFGSLENYQKYAKEMISNWGLLNTIIGTVDASGYDAGTISTAADLAIIGSKVMENPVLSEIVAKTEAEVAMAGEIENTNKLLGESGISGIKTGYIGDPSGYCIVTGYKKDNHIYTISLLGAATRSESFDDSLAIVQEMQTILTPTELVSDGEIVGYYDSWWTGTIPIKALDNFSEVNYNGATSEAAIFVTDDEDGKTKGMLKIKIEKNQYDISLEIPDFPKEPSLFQKFLHVFGWKA